MKITEKNEFILKIKAYITLKGISFFPVILHPKNLTFFSRFDKEINIVSNKIKLHNFEIHNGKQNVITFKIVELIKNKPKYLAVEEHFSIFVAIGTHTKRENKKFPKDAHILHKL